MCSALPENGYSPRSQVNVIHAARARAREAAAAAARTEYVSVSVRAHAESVDGSLSKSSICVVHERI